MERPAASRTLLWALTVVGAAGDHHRPSTVASSGRRRSTAVDDSAACPETAAAALSFITAWPSDGTADTAPREAGLHAGPARPLSRACISAPTSRRRPPAPNQPAHPAPALYVYVPLAHCTYTYRLEHFAAPCSDTACRSSTLVSAGTGPLEGRSVSAGKWTRKASREALPRTSETMKLLASPYTASRNSTRHSKCAGGHQVGASWRRSLDPGPQKTRLQHISKAELQTPKTGCCGALGMGGVFDIGMHRS